MFQISQEEYSKLLHKYNVTDCVVRDNNFFYFIAREDYTKWPKEKWDREETPPPEEEDLQKHVIVFNRKKIFGKRMGGNALTNFDYLLAGAATHPKPQFIGVSHLGEVFVRGSGERGIQGNITGYSKGGPYKGGAFKLRTIDGWLYFCGGNNSVGKRISKDEWFSHSHLIPERLRTDNLRNSFDDLDGFSEQDIYAVGTGGKVAHYNGKEWRYLEFPTNIDLETVCCAGDGQVYISGEYGMIFKGRGNSWKLINKKSSFSFIFKDMVWYEDRVWCTDDSGVWNIIDEKLERANLPDGISAYAGNLSAADGVLLLAGYNGAAFKEGGQWTKIFSETDMRNMIT